MCCSQLHSLARQQERSKRSYKGLKFKMQKHDETVPAPKQPSKPNHHPAQWLSPAMDSADGKRTGEAVLGSWLWQHARPTHHIPTHHTQPLPKKFGYRTARPTAQLCISAGTGVCRAAAALVLVDVLAVGSWLVPGDSWRKRECRAKCHGKQLSLELMTAHLPSLGAS